MAYSSLGKNPLIISHNVRGLNVPEKRTSLLRELQKGKPQIVYLQETHFRTHHVPKLTNSHFTRAFHATNNDSRSKGVSILLSKNTPFELTEQLSDPEGRFIFLRDL
uniref:LINE-1 reverse transcriptase homolog n=1 Tax=Aquarana catesbeiana TaxID=8400 RepID=C1C4Y3_AQUCT|nr:LINE-1 reverse transcriptase homolog [Aquarana catesbeiana]